MIAIIIGFAAPVAAVAGIDNLSTLDVTSLHVIGVIVTIVGIALTVIAQFAMAESWRIGVDPNERTPLVTTGAFAMVRNPIFTAMLVTATGLTLTIPNVVSVIGLVALIAALESEARRGAILVVTHGTDYRRYAQRVGRFAPTIGRLS